MPDRWFGREVERGDDVTFLDVTVWGVSADNCGKYLRKGSSVHVEGSLRVDSWEDKNTGEKRTKVKVTADNVQFLGGRADGAGGSAGMPDEAGSEVGAYPAPSRDYGGGAGAGGGSGYGGSGYGGGAGASRGAAPARKPEPAETEEIPDPEDEDIPF